MKSTELVKFTGETGLKAACDLLNRVLDLKISAVYRDPKPNSILGTDGRVEFDQGDVAYALIIKVLPDGAPRFVRSMVLQLMGHLEHVRQSGQEDCGRHLIPMLVSPYLSPQSRSICADHGVAYLDRVGNALVSFNSVYINRAVAEKPKSEARSLGSLFSPKAGAVLRVLLQGPEQTWRVMDLAAAANVSLGHVSNIRKALLAREWIEERKNGIILAQPDALLRTWRKEYRPPTDRQVTGYTLFHGDQLNKQLPEILNPNPQRPRAILSAHSAAQWLAPFARSGTLSFYADEPGMRKLKMALNIAHTQRGSNAIVRIPKDETLFADAVQPVPGIYCTNPVVTYLDLYSGNDRDREAADHMASEYYPWL